MVEQDHSLIYQMANTTYAWIQVLFGIVFPLKISGTFLKYLAKPDTF
jgi:hypothetical protein